MIITKNTVKGIASECFEILHISDTHLTLADARDDERKNVLAEKRHSVFPEAVECLELVTSLSHKKNVPIICTGDLIDFVSEKNLDYAASFISGNDVFTAAGNHEFSLYVGEAWEDEEYRNRSLAKVQKAFSNDIRFSSRIIESVNFVAVDNSYYRFDRFQLESLKAEAQKGAPVVLCVHAPIYTADLYDYAINVLGNTDAGLMSVPEDGLSSYSDYRYRQQKEDEVTHEAYEYIVSEKNIKLILCGHLHYNYTTFVGNGLPQLVTGCEDIRQIRFEP